MTLLNMLAPIPSAGRSTARVTVTVPSGAVVVTVVQHGRVTTTAMRRRYFMGWWVWVWL